MEIDTEKLEATLSRSEEHVSTPIESDPTAKPLRDSVLAGAFLGSSHTRAAALLDEMISGLCPTLDTWFGAEAESLRCNPFLLTARLDRDIAIIDRMISYQLDKILHHPRLRRLEGSWRGLAWLASHLPLSRQLKLRVLTASWPEVCRDLERAVEFDQSQLFQRIHEDEFGIAGGEPYSLLVADYEVRHKPSVESTTDDVSALSSLTSIAAAAFAPIVIGASPTLLGVDHFSDLSGLVDPASIMSTIEFNRWNRLCTLPDARFMAVTMPRILMRIPWQENAYAHRSFCYQERIKDISDLVSTTAGYLVAACTIRAFEAYAWPADIRGYDIDRVGGGVVESLPTVPFSVSIADGFRRTSLDVILTDQQERILISAGLLPICSLPYGGEALIGAARSLHTDTSSYIGPNAPAAGINSRISSFFNNVICVSRFAHYVRIMGRDMTGSFKSAEEIQTRLQRWLTGYTNSNTSAGPETKARYPLREASISVDEKPENPGVFSCTIHLQPHFQLDDVSVSFQLVTEIVSSS